MQPNNTIKINEKIKFIRSLKSWTQEQVADKLGISTHAYAKIERGETDVNLLMLSFYETGDQKPTNIFLCSCLDTKVIKIMK